MQCAQILEGCHIRRDSLHENCPDLCCWMMWGQSDSLLAAAKHLLLDRQT